MLVVISSLICMWMLHIATFYYVKGILRFEAAFQRTPGYTEDEKAKQFFSAGLSKDSVSFGSLQDSGTDLSFEGDDSQATMMVVSWVRYMNHSLSNTSLGASYLFSRSCINH